MGHRTEYGIISICFQASTIIFFVLTVVPVWWLLRVTPSPISVRLQLLRTRVTGLGVLTTLLLSEWLLLLLLLMA